ncbi:hypothetical protein HRV97_00615 [Sphingomonas sp. HHU CXW]|uniref:DUF2946 domain-containing protein n=1 Tax=Sphingomonas hominis TaxID=2741495 RepID=A0ABX2JIC9_9SPHN|nr:hypothetical protein [Sphingomonas hominis]NTS63658.1 hypothetical protein [Sphingomonas hominis]
MLRRLLLLLALIVALPATARPACHDAGASCQAEPQAQAGMHHATAPHHTSGQVNSHAGGEQRGSHADGHDCLGCIPPDMLLGARLGGAIPPVVRAAPARAVRFAPGETIRPTPPPPKTA